MTKRKAHWKQETPRSEAIALCSAAQGEVLNLQDGDAHNPTESLRRAWKALEQVQEILHTMPEGEWS